MEADEAEIDEDEWDEAEPIDKTIGPHVLVITVEVGKDAFLHIFGLPKMSNDEWGSVVGQKPDEQVDPNGGDPTSLKPHDGQDQPIVNNHSNAQAKDNSSGADIITLIKPLIVFLNPRIV